MNRFFVSDIGPGTAGIAGEDLKHLSSVLRLKKGDHVMLSDGKGSECEGEIEALEPGRARVKTGPWRPCVSEPHHKLTVFQCLPKAGKMETIIQKCTELGVNAMVPVYSARCVVQPGREYDKKLQRYRKVAREAAMQSGRGWVPGVGRRIALFIGPEGGFEAAEVEALQNKGAQVISLGPRILRTETAGMAMVAQILYELEE